MTLTAADWLRSNGRTVSPFGEQAAALVADLFGGIYHLQDAQRIDWSNDRFVEIPLWQPLATYDWDHLTRLVVLAHDLCIRAELSAASVPTEHDGQAYTAPAILLRLHPRARTGDIYSRHPEITQAIDTARSTRSIA